jgi:hypothetical protein
LESRPDIWSNRVVELLALDGDLRAFNAFTGHVLVINNYLRVLELGGNDFHAV